MSGKNKSAMKSMSKFLLTLMISLLCCSSLSTGQARMGRAKIPFKGNATGGKLVIGYIPDPHYVCISNVSIDTFPNESAESVVNRLAIAITSSDAIYSNMSKNPKNAETMRKEMAQGNTLSIINIPYTYILLAGTETGLGIPMPPLCLSCSYNKEARTIDVRWVNPPGDCQYDSLRILWRYRSLKDTLGSGGRGSKSIWETQTYFTIKLPEEINDLDTDIWIKGLRHEMPIEEMRAKDIPLSDNVVPSNATAIHLTSDGCSQEETYGIPFTAGIAPNWMAWNTTGDVKKGMFEQGDKYIGLRIYKPVTALLTKPYYQVINVLPKGEVHGVCRKFLGLTPGHTYRLTACMSTLDMDSVQGDWSFSLHATHNGAGGKDLSPQQMAGLAALPGGKRGPEAARIANYHRGKTTKGSFDLSFSGDKVASEIEDASHITLPSDANEITVWVRFSCSDPVGKVGFSGVKLEDITGNPNPKSPEQIISEEIQQEKELLMREEKALLRETQKTLLDQK